MSICKCWQNSTFLIASTMIMPRLRRVQTRVYKIADKCSTVNLTSSSAMADRLCDCLHPKSSLCSCQHCQWFCAGLTRHKRRRSYSSDKKQGPIGRAGTTWIGMRQTGPAQNISLCRKVGILQSGWVTFGIYFTGKGRRPLTSDAVRKLEWLPFCVVSKYPQSII